MMAARLPLELQQHIFQYLDPRSFHAARNVCRWWRHASKDSVTVATQLRRLPIAPSVSPKTLGSERLQSLYDEAAYILMLGLDTTVSSSAASDAQSLSHRIEHPKIALSGDGRRAATLNNREITLWNLETPQCSIISRRPLNDLRMAIGGGPWFKCAPTSVFELALSEDGRILAIALERTIQIYDLAAESDSWPVSSYVPSACGHYIAGLEFQHNDSVLRVRLSNKGVVVYLGTPQDSSEGLNHWHGKTGLKHAFMDSSTVILRPSSAARTPEILAGMQLLHPFEGGWLFAAQKQCTTTHSACYCIGHVTASTSDSHGAATGSIATILAELPSSMNATPIPQIVHGFWHDLPSAHVQHPHFSLSADGKLLSMSESRGVPAHSGEFSRLFIFRMPSTKRLSATLRCLSTAGHGEEKQKLETKDVLHEARHLIQRLPLSIGTIKGTILNFGFDEPDHCDVGTRARYQLSAVTELGTKTWSLLDS